MLHKDYYQILGVEKSASAEDVKKAFRRLAHQFHPDKPTGDAEKFKEVNEAYQVIGDPEKRRTYDQFGSAAFDGSAGGQGFGGFNQGFGGFQSAGFEDLGDLFGNMFGFGGAQGGRRRERRGNDIQVDIEIAFRDAVFGVDREIRITKTSACERCGGAGGEPGASRRSCGACNGRGVRTATQRTVLGTIQTNVTCSDCGGEGEIHSAACTNCRGAGVLSQKKTLNVSIPAGVEDEAVLRLRGEGEAVKGGASGDLYVRIHVGADHRFQREGSTIYSILRIGFSQAALGDIIKVETVDGQVELSVPPGTQTGAKLRLRGKGVLGRSGRGDQIVVVEVVTPTRLSKQQRKMLEELDLTE